MQGFNMGRYYPPNEDSAPSFNRTSHPLGSRAKKANQGILTVRFELPFAVWCETCKPEAIIGQGVRFNAEKKKVGNYHSTPIWSFRMKHTACGGWWEIRTDPKNAEYVVVEGARRRDYGPDEIGKGEGELAFLTEEERSRRREDAFARLEGTNDEKAVMKKNTERVEELLEQAEAWKDPYSANQKLRRVFRAERKALEKEAKSREAIQDKFSFGYEIEDEKEIDRVRAGLVEFGAKDLEEEVARRGIFEAKSEGKAADATETKGKLKTQILQDKTRSDLRRTLVGNTKAAVDPFLNGTVRTTTRSGPILKLKRKRDDEGSPEGMETPAITEQVPSGIASAAQSDQKPSAQITLVNYDSD